LVDGAGGQMLAGESSLPAGLAPDLPRAALAASLALRAQQHAARTMAQPPVEEVSVTCGDHQHLLRTLAGRPGLFLLALLDRKRTNVALVRLKLREAERALS
jgi:predicted regulator of Ras-like GTPase activity (Roadblock/LC7/MglB family)